MKVTRVSDPKNPERRATLECQHCGFSQIETILGREVAGIHCRQCGKNSRGVENPAAIVYAVPDDVGLENMIKHMPPGRIEIGENKVKAHTNVDLLCVSISTKIIPVAKALDASQAEILTAMLKTTALYAKHVNKPALATNLDEIVKAYEAAIAEGKSGLLGAPGTEVVKAAEIDKSTEA